MRVVFWKSALALAVVVTLGYAINNQYIQTYAPNDITGSLYSWWGPSTAVGPTWVHSFLSQYSGWAQTAAWNGGWRTSGIISAPNGSGGQKPVGDVYLAYDSLRSRYVMAATSEEEASSSLYFSTSSDGLNWSTLQAVLSGPGLGGAFDYGSVAVDSAGRIIVGAVKYFDNLQTSSANGYWVRTSSDGGNSWSTPYEVASPNPGDQRWGINSRVVAAGNHFLVFTPSLQPGVRFQPTAVSYYFESGGSWSGPSLLMSFSAPMNNSPTTYNGNSIYYAPLIDASGNSSGKWAVTFQMNWAGYNNVNVCTGIYNSPSGCTTINPAYDDEFMNGVSVDPNGGVWLSYLTYSTLFSRQVPLYHQTIYFPVAGGVLGATGDYNVAPTSWYLDRAQFRCGPSCWAEGDYARIGSNAYLGVDSPYVKQAPPYSCGLFQIFASDPQGATPPNTFTPHPVYYPPGAVLQGSAGPNPASTLGIPPEDPKRRKVPGWLVAN